jgi:enamine deaminase RidA (YjgF/YER057c/UK114 family)
VQVKVTYITIP